MKYAKFAAVVLILYFLGYILGPTINRMLVNDREPENLLKVAVKYLGATYEIDLAEYRDNDLPETIKMKEAISISTLSGEGKVNLRKDDKVKLLNRNGNELIIETMDGIAKGTVSPRSTDIYEVLAQKKYNDEAAKNGMVQNPTPPVTPTPAPGPAPMPAPGPGPAPTPVPAPVEPVAVVDPTPAPGPSMPAVEPIPEPTTPDPAPAAGGDLTNEQIVELMKASITGGAVKEFKAEQVKGWQASEKETVDGTEYQTGLAAYEAATIFGVRPVQAKALIKGGKIERWVYAKSGMEIQ